MPFTVAFTDRAEADLIRLYQFIIDRDENDGAVAEEALTTIVATTALLKHSPFSCRKVSRTNPFIRELVIPLGQNGFVALFEIMDGTSVLILAVRHQRESDYH